MLDGQAVLRRPRQDQLDQIRELGLGQLRRSQAQRQHGRAVERRDKPDLSAQRVHEQGLVRLGVHLHAVVLRALLDDLAKQRPEGRVLVIGALCVADLHHHALAFADGLLDPRMGASGGEAVQRDREPAHQ